MWFHLYREPEEQNKLKNKTETLKCKEQTWWLPDGRWVVGLSVKRGGIKEYKLAVTK